MPRVNLADINPSVSLPSEDVLAAMVLVSYFFSDEVGGHVYYTDDQEQHALISGDL